MIELESIRCAICSGNNEELLIEAKNIHGARLISEERFNLVKCKNCGLVYINPRPVQHEINKYYGFDYYSSGDRFKAFVTELFLPYFMLKKKSIIMQFKKSGRILDIGCGNGNFLSSFSSDNKYKLYGVEPNPIGYNLCRQKINGNIFNKELLDCKFPGNYFDIVTMWHVLEHIHKPKEELEEVNRILKKDGFLIIAIPNINGLGFKISKMNWFHLDAPRHLYHYDLISIKKILSKNGFRILKIIFPFYEFPLDLYHSLLNYLAKDRFIRVLFMLPVLVFSLILKPLCSLFKISETIIVICRRAV